MTDRFLFLLAILFCGFSVAHSQQVLQDEAAKNASRFYGKVIVPSTTNKTNARMSTATPSLHLVEIGGTKASPEYYVFNIGNGNGFMLVSGDNRMNPVSLYTLSGSYEQVKGTPFYKTYLTNYSEKVRSVRMGNEVGRFNAVMPIAEEVQETVIPLTTQWNQFDPYNLQLKAPSGTLTYPTGCVATALSQVLKFYNYPERVQGTGSVLYYDAQDKPIGSTQTVTLGNTPFDWEHMLDIYPNAEKAPIASDKNNIYNKAVAYLMQQAGAAVNMRYHRDASGASSRLASVVLKSKFKYSNTLEYAYKQLYTDQEWRDLMREELKAGRPILYSANSAQGGHSYVCVGYNNANYFAYNMGWGFTPAWTTELGGEGFVINPEMAIGIQKPGGAGTTRYQLAMLSSMNLSEHELSLGGKFNAIIRIANYGINHYSGECALGLYKDEKMIQTLATAKVDAPVSGENGPVGAEGVDLRPVNVSFTDVVVPAALEEDRYQLKLVLKQSDGSWQPMQANVQNVLNKVMLTVGNEKKVSFSYPTRSAVSPLILGSKLDMTIGANNIGTARLEVINVDSLAYHFKGTIYLMGQKVGDTGLPQVFGKTVIDELPTDESRLVTISDIVVSSGLYTYYVAYSPASAQGEGIGTVPLLPEKLNYYLYNVPVETVKQTWDFTKMAIPTSFKLYENDVVNPKIWGSIPGQSNAVSFFMDESPVGSHILVTDGIEVSDENAVISWSVSAVSGKGLLPYEVYVSTKGQGVENFQKYPTYRVSDFSKPFVSDAYKISLADYVGEKVYIGFKHLSDGVEGSGISIDKIQLLDIKAPKNISLLNVITPTSCEKEKSQNIMIEVKNRTALTLNKIKASYTVNGGTPVVEEIPFSLPYENTLQYTFRRALLAAEPLGTQRVIEVKVELEGEDQTLLEDNKMTVQSQVLDFVPKKNFFLSKFTNPTCTGCKLSASYFNQFERINPSTFSGIEVWTGTALQDPANTFSAYYSWGTPMFALNGPKNTLPIWGGGTTVWDQNIQELLDKQQTAAEVDVTSSFLNEESRTLTVKVKSRFALPAKGTYRMTAYILENGVFSEGKGLNHIPIGVTPSGVLAEKAPAITNPEVGVEYEYSATFQLPEQKGDRFKKENIQVVGLLFNPKGSIENTAVDCHYVRFNETAGLNFISEPGCEPFRHVTEADPISGPYKPISIARARVINGNDFKFRIEKGGVYAGKVIRVMMNRKEELYPDAQGVYTLNKLNQHAFMLIETNNKPELDFSIIKNGHVVYDGDELMVDLAEEENNQLAMKFNFDILAKKEMSILMKREEIDVVKGSSNSMCFGTCYTPEISVTPALTFSANVTYEGLLYATCYQPLNSKGITIVRYTFEAIDRDEKKSQMSVTVRYVAPAAATYRLSEEGSSLIFSGNWKAKHFDDLGLLRYQVTGLDMTSITPPADVLSITTGNPNSLIYIAPYTVVPNTWKNVVKGDKATTIELKAGYNFEVLKPFTADILRVEYDFTALQANDWATLCLPFDVPSNLLGDMKAERYQAFAGNEVKMEPVTSFEAYKAYTVQPSIAGKRVFEAAHVALPVTQPSIPAIGLNANFVTVLGKGIAGGSYTLSTNGISFMRSFDNTVLPAWSAYLQLPESAQASFYDVLHVPGVGLSESYIAGRLTIESTNGVVTIRTATAQWITVTDTTGRVVRLLPIEAGTTIVNDLPIGTYIINRQKVVVGS